MRSTSSAKWLLLLLIMSNTANTIKNEIMVEYLGKCVSDEMLEQTCSQFGKVLDREIIRHNGISLGFGFVKFASENEASRAAQVMNNAFYKMQPLNVRFTHSNMVVMTLENNIPKTETACCLASWRFLRNSGVPGLTEMVMSERIYLQVNEYTPNHLFELTQRIVALGEEEILKCLHCANYFDEKISLAQEHMYEELREFLNNQNCVCN